ncbi:MAG: murein hydrolase activator EnvC family protein [Coriobacteriia bacterium]
MWRQFLVILVFAGLFVGPAYPAAGAWPVPASGGVILGYGQTYLRDGDQAVHRGIDIGAPAGSSVRAAEAGEVSFAGLVPGVSGQVYAVSVRTAQGFTVTCMPLETVLVVAGDGIAVGDALGFLAEQGDLSSSGPHVHLSLRREQTYLDPTGVLGVQDSSQQAPASLAPAPVAVPDAPQRLDAVSSVNGPAAQAAKPAAAPQARAETAAPSAASDVEAARAPSVEIRVPQADTPELSTTDSPWAFTQLPAHIGVDTATSPRMTPSAEPRLGPAARVLGRLSRAPDIMRSPIVVLGGCLAAVAGLWPLWRPDPRTHLIGGVRPTLDNVAAVVGR